MANEEHVALVRRHAGAINVWREENPDTELDLQNLDQAPGDLELAKLAPVNLKGANLRGANLRGANLKGAILKASNLESANLEGADLRSANLQNARLRGANLKGVDLKQADLQNVDLQHADLQVADLGGADLRGANLLGAAVKSAILFHADLRGAELFAADLKGSILRGANLEGANLEGAKNASLGGAHGYLLDGVDISTWRFPAWSISLVSEWNWRRFWRVFKLPYIDPWSTVRRSYTGVMTAFHLIFFAMALGPYIYRALKSYRPGEIGCPRIGVLVGWDVGWWPVVSSIGLIAYNLVRVVLTWWLSQLREEELRSNHAPAKSSYWWCWVVHSRFMWGMAWAAIGLGSARTAGWLFEWV